MGTRAVDLRKGTVLEQDGDLLVITEYTHKTPGNLRAIIQIKTKNLTTGQSNTMRLGSGDMVEVAYLDRRKSEYLYRESNGDFVFMNSEDYEQFTLTKDFVGDKMGFVKENTEVEVTFHGECAVGVALPMSVTLKVVEAEHAVKGNTATNVKKDAKLETGLAVKVPLHVVVGDMIKVNTENGDFQGRVKD
ncbi:MAG: elongation factor P [Planctomycetota bacterium]|jgi:elongation factor P